jgi:hypothetical protein
MGLHMCRDETKSARICHAVLKAYHATSATKRDGAELLHRVSHVAPSALSVQQHSVGLRPRTSSVYRSSCAVLARLLEHRWGDGWACKVQSGS